MRIGVLQCGHETSWVNTHMFGVTITMDDAGMPCDKLEEV
jgi:hypothetical protein